MLLDISNIRTLKVNGGIANYLGKTIAGHTMIFHSVTSNYEK
jgi:hypothetical protein